MPPLESIDGLSLTRPLPAGENAVFRVTCPHGDAILRITPKGHRTEKDLEAELDFLGFLAGRGYPVARPLRFTSGDMIEPIGDGRFASLFELAPGAPVEAFGAEWNEAFFFAWGLHIGRLHELSADYSNHKGRYTWREERTARWMADHLDGIPHQSHKRLVRALEDSTRDSLVVHGDFGRVNFHRDGDRLVVFDFDDCMEHAPAYDIAVALWPSRGRPSDERDRYLDWMVSGYRSVRELDVEELPLMFEWRTLYMFAHHLRKWGQRITPEQAQWLKNIERQIREPIEWKLPGRT